MFDKEYSTQWVAEMQWLRSQGIRYSFVKTIDKITTYKYEKTSELFKALAIFYAKKGVINNEENNKSRYRKNGGTV